MVYHTDMSKVLFLVVGRGRNDDDPVYLNTLHKAINESAAGKIYLLTTADGRRYAEKIKDGYASSKCVEIKDFDEENMEFDADKINKPYIHRDCKTIQLKNETMNIINKPYIHRDCKTSQTVHHGTLKINKPYIHRDCKTFVKKLKISNIINKPYIHRDCKITINLVSCPLCKRDMSTGVLKFCDEFFIKER